MITKIVATLVLAGSLVVTGDAVHKSIGCCPLAAICNFIHGPSTSSSDDSGDTKSDCCSKKSSSKRKGCCSGRSCD